MGLTRQSFSEKVSRCYARILHNSLVFWRS